MQHIYTEQFVLEENVGKAVPWRQYVCAYMQQNTFENKIHTCKLFVKAPEAVKNGGL